MNRTDNHPQTKKNHKNEKPSQTSSKAPNQGDGVGEGNRAATRRYNEGLAKSVASGDSEALAKAAKQALDGTEREDLEKAEAEGKRGEPTVTSRR
jgi:hypothetical protein